jgi:hypothetical protein
MESTFYKKMGAKSAAAFVLAGRQMEHLTNLSNARIKRF